MKSCNNCQSWLKDNEGIIINGKWYCDRFCYDMKNKKVDLPKDNKTKDNYRQAMPNENFFDELR